MNPNSEKVTNDPDALLHTVEEIAKHPLVRSSITFVTAVKKASAGLSDNPFSGRITTARRFNEWVLNHKEFVASHWMRPKKKKDDKSESADALSSKQPA
jgi:hypothetical protein